MPTGPFPIRRPLLAFAIAVVAGIVGSAAASPGGAWTALAAVALLPAAAAAWGFAGTRAGPAAWLVFGALAGAAMHAGAADATTEARRVLGAVPDGVLVRARFRVDREVSALAPTGTLSPADGLPGVRVPSCVLAATLDALDAGAGWQPASAEIRIVVGRGLPAELPGDRREVVARLVHPRPPGNPGAVVPVDRAAVLLLAPCDAALRPAGAADWRLGVRRAAAALRRAAEGWLVAACAPDDAALLAALLLGDAAGVADRDRRAFRGSGTLHVLAVSGLHVAIVLGALAWALARLGVARRRALVAVLVLAAAYAALAGLRVPIVRAACMAGLGAVAWRSAQRFDGWSALAAAAVALAVADPMAPLEPGWQLSFAAVAALLLVAPALTGPPAGVAVRDAHAAPDRRYALRAALAASVAATLGTAPLLWQHFGLVTPVAVLANLAAIPCCAVLLVTGLAALPLLALGGPGAAAAGGLLSLGCAALRSIAELAAGLPGAWWSLPRPGWGVVAVAGLALWWVARGGLGRHPRASVAALAAVLAWAVWPSGASPVPLVTVLDVGQGSATLLRLPAGQRVLVDAGSSSLPRGGARPLIDALHAVGVGRIDLLVLSHADADHLNAVAELVEHLPVDAVCAGPAVAEREAGRALLRHLVAGGRPVHRAVDGVDSARLGPGLALAFLHPPDPPGPLPLAGNEASLVVVCRTPHATVCIPGDIEEAGTAALLARHGDDLRADVLVAPHHGGANRLWPALLDAVRPRCVLVSAGRAFPIEASLQVLRARGIPVAVTARHGAVEVWGDAGGVRWRNHGAAPLPALSSVQR